MMYLYCITDRGVVLEGRRGLEDVVLQAVDAGDLVAVCTEHDTAQVPQTEEALWRHEEVVEALMQHVTILPVRWSTLLRDREAVVDVLKERGDEYRRALDALRGCVEVGVRVIGPEPRTAPKTSAVVDSGRAYLLEKLDALQRSDAAGGAATAALDALVDQVGGKARTFVRDTTGGGGAQTSAAFLVRTDAVQAFCTAVDEYGASHSEVKIVCTGPWPPYNFVSWATDPARSRDSSDG